MRLLYLYPEEWLGSRAREIHTLSTCAALAREGVEITLATAGPLRRTEQQLRDLTGATARPHLHFIALTRRLGPIRSTAMFGQVFRFWLRRQPCFDAAFAIHVKAAAMLKQVGLPYLYEAHEIFAETPQKNPDRQQELHELEGAALAGATWRVATSRPLAAALRAHYALPNDFTIAPNAGAPPLPQSVADPEGPFVYAGSIADWKGLETVLAAAHEAGVRLKVIGGTAGEWKRLREAVPAGDVVWAPRVAAADLPAALAGARAGLVPTRPDTPSGRYSCPMKLFDYARCGLPVLTTALASLDSFNPGSWCLRVERPTVAAWAEAMRAFRGTPVLGETARAWAGVHTWAERAEKLLRLFQE